MSIFSDALKVGKTIDEAYQSACAYQLCAQLTDSMVAVVDDMYANCSTIDNPSLKAALLEIKTACKGFDLYSYFFSSTKEVLGFTIDLGLKAVDGLIDSVILNLPAGRAVLIGQFMGKTISNWLFSTDELIESYYKMEALYNVELLMRKTVNTEISRFRSKKTKDNANNLFSAVELFFNTYEVSCDYGTNFTKIMHDAPVASKKLREDTNSILQSISHIKSIAKSEYDRLINKNWLPDLDYEYPDIFEALSKQKKDIAKLKEYVSVKNIEFPNSEIEIGLDDMSYVLDAKVSPDNATNKEIVYTSSDPSIAEVAGSCLYANSVGTITVTARSIDSGRTATMTVHVVEGHGSDGTESSLNLDTVKDGDTFTHDGCTYQVISAEGKTLSLTKCETSKSGYFDIPEFVKYRGRIFTVTTIGGEAFAFCTGLTSIVIPDTVESVYSNSSFGSYVLMGSFYGCSGLKTVTIGKNAKSESGNAFYRCDNVTKVIWTEGRTSIDGTLISSLKGTITEVKLPNSLKTIEPSAFEGCTKLKSISIPDTVTEMGNSAFKNCTSLTSFTIPKGVKKLNGEVFANCTGLTSIVIPDTVESVYSNSSFGSYVLMGSFYGCSGLKTVTIGKNAKSESGNAFYHCDNVTKVIFTDGTTETNANLVHSLGGSVEEVIMPSSLEKISDRTFSAFVKITNIIVPNNVTSIGSSAFEGCTKLKSISIPDTVTEMGDSAFKNCTSLTSFTIPKGVKKLNGEVFANCTDLTSIVIPDTVESVYSNSSFDSYVLMGSFYGCSGLKTVTIGKNAKSESGNAFYHCNNVTKVIFTDGTTETNANLVHSLSGSVEEIVLPSTLTTIGSSTFSGCNNLTDVFYAGSEPEYNEIVIESNNFPLGDATIHYGWTPPTGDVNADNEFNIADVVMMQRWLLCAGDLTYWQAGDLCKDNRIDVFDLVMMKRMLISQMQ